MNRNYLKTGRASDLDGKDRVIYRFLEVLPGFLSWGTIIGVIVLSFVKPVWIAIFIIVFDVYWLIKTAYLSMHLRANWKRFRQNLKTDWSERLENLKTDRLWQMVMLPFYKEDYETIQKTITSLIESKWPNEKMIIVFSGEERAGEKPRKIADRITEEFGNKFGYFLSITHPDGLEGELAGKGSNIAWAAEQVRVNVLNKNNIRYENVLVSAFDIDTRVYPQYFECLTWHFLTAVTIKTLFFFRYFLPLMVPKPALIFFSKDLFNSS